MKNKESIFSKYSPQFWLVIMFEFFERGAYYGMMSFLSVYFSDTLNIPKENIGEIKGVIQPLLYFLPILSGAIADRFGYRRMLLIAFSLLGGGYFLTSQMTSYSMVFISLVIMGIGAGIFKPIISGTIASVTDETNSTQAFGIYYWAINLGAFLFPFFLVPYLKNINPSFVIIAAGISTATMIIPTLLFFKDPKLKKKVEEREQTSLIQTIANAFEIIYSPIVLIVGFLKRRILKYIIYGLIVIIFVFSLNTYLSEQPSVNIFSKISYEKSDINFFFEVNRNMLKKEGFKINKRNDNEIKYEIIVYKPETVLQNIHNILNKIKEETGLSTLSKKDLEKLIKYSLNKIKITSYFDNSIQEKFLLQFNNNNLTILLKDDNAFLEIDNILNSLHKNKFLKAISKEDIEKLFNNLGSRSFFLLFVILIIISTMIIVSVKKSFDLNLSKGNSSINLIFKFSKLIAPLFILFIWLIPGISTLGRIISSVIALSITSLFAINTDEHSKFEFHFKFLLMILIYSIFWVLYFQMFDSVLWYVKAYVDASSLNNAVNGFLNIFGINIDWFFDVEHVTVINAGTIIILQLIISAIVKKMKALPTMVVGISIATIGMGILSISTHIWVFIIGIILFSIGEMTAHPKFISYIGLIAPPENKALYMGYIFLYGVFGSSIGSIIGAKLYVHYVDNLNNPSLLWLIFSAIGVFGIISLLLYNRYLLPRKQG